MPFPCATCTHPKVREINSRLRDGTRLTDISRWLDEVGQPITRQALARHGRDHMGLMAPHGGQRPVAGRLLETIVEKVEDGLANGSLTVTTKDGIAAQKALDERAAKSKDQDLMVRIAMVLTGNIQLPTYRLDPAVEAIEAEFRPLLTSGD